MRVADKDLSGIQAEGIRRKRSTSLEVVDDLLRAVIVARDRILAWNVPLNVLGQKSTHNVGLATRVHPVLRVVQCLEHR